MRTTICIKVYERIYKSAKDKEITINSIPSSNRWSNGKDKPGDRNVFTALCELPIRQLDELASCSRVSVQWQEICSNGKNIIQVKLQKTFLKRGPYGSNGDFMSRRIPNQNTEKLGTGNKDNGGSTNNLIREETLKD